MQIGSRPPVGAQPVGADVACAQPGQPDFHHADARVKPGAGILQHQSLRKTGSVVELCEPACNCGTPGRMRNGMVVRKWILRTGILYIVPVLALAAGRVGAITPERKAQIEADWRIQARAVSSAPSRRGRARGKVTTKSDAAGGCDGIKDGTWGFHTQMSDNPWWQVDLGKSQPVARVVVWNRCDATASRNNRLTIKLSDDGKKWRTVYSHNGTTFGGAADKKPLDVRLENQSGRFVRLQIPGHSYFHLDEVEVFGPSDAKKNLALGRPADQNSVSQWSRAHGVVKKPAPPEPKSKPPEAKLAARWARRRKLLSNPLLDFDAILFTKRVPGSYSHMSDQYYGWWSRPGGGIYILRSFKSDNPTVECITESFKAPGSFLRPMLSYDAKKVLFAWCKHYPRLRGERNKMDKNNVPEDAFYHIFEMSIDGAGVRQLTRGKYDDFDARYLPDGRIVFLSTRRGHAIQVGRGSARRTLQTPDLPDTYVRCGGGPGRPVAIYTLHTMDREGGNLCAISPFENFEWTPSVADDGTILHARWDYVDRHNHAFMSLWALRPDGTNARIVYGNHTRRPLSVFEARSIPNSHKIIFTASAHHAQTMGSLVLLDTAVGTEGPAPITRLTPEVKFPEIEGWSNSSYANPWPLSERLYLVAWACNAAARQGRSRAPNGMGLYLFDAKTRTKELLYRDPAISCMYPIPIRPRRRPPIHVSEVTRDGPKEGRFLMADVYRGLEGVKRGRVKALRVVAVPPKTHPTMNRPSIGLTREDPGKCVLGTVPVEPDGSAYFRVPSGVVVFFQALDARGMAVQTMRTTTHVQPGQTLGCIGCHESRLEAPATRHPMASAREPSKLTVGPGGSWPLRFDRLVQPLLDAKCVRCHSPRSKNAKAAKFNLTAAKAYRSLCGYGKPNLYALVRRDYASPHGASKVDGCAAANSAVLAKLMAPKGHHDVKLTAADLERLIVWMDTYAQRLGSFSDDQEKRLLALRKCSAALLIEREQ